MIALLAAALASLDLNLELVCQAQWPETEVSQSFTPKQGANGWWHSEVTRSTTEVTRTGVVHVSLHGDGGTLNVGAGEPGALVNVVADERTILAEYKLGRSTRHVKIDRMTGELRLLDGTFSTLDGVCSPESSQPKF